MVSIKVNLKAKVQRLNDLAWSTDPRRTKHFANILVKSIRQAGNPAYRWRLLAASRKQAKLNKART